MGNPKNRFVSIKHCTGCLQLVGVDVTVEAQTRSDCPVPCRLHRLAQAPQAPQAACSSTLTSTREAAVS